MKQFNTILLLTLFTFVSITAFGQKRKKSSKNDGQIYAGYVVTANHNDTLFGEIQFLNPVYNEQTVIFHKDGEKFQYFPADGIISEYGFQYKDIIKKRNP
ncbi:MAG: hypothetical protein HC803_06890 [Saprospiraceae bacterium]|nr:hypothetical protein [Saprospiraceae bacterium]